MSNLERLTADTEFGYLNHRRESDRVENPVLVANEPDNSMLAALRSELLTASSFIFSVAFVSSGGLGAIKQSLVDFAGRGTIIVSDYLDFNDPDALRELLALPNIEARIISGVPHHAKGYVFRHGDHATAIVGSSNLTRNALMSTREWNLKFSTHRDGDIADQLERALDHHVRISGLLTEEWIQSYEQRRQQRVIVTDATDQPHSVSADGVEILPNKMQTEALERLQTVIDSGETRALIISATGTGKTILAALAAQRFDPKRVLFVAHTEQILRNAAREFKKVFRCPEEDIGFFVGRQRQLDKRFVFATVQSLSRLEHLTDISPKLFEYMIIDEVHRSGAESYKRIMEHFRPDFLLGLTATPERTDGFNVFELFHHNVPFEIRLGDALESRMLVPFDYYGVSDYESMSGYTITDDSTADERVSKERVDHVVETLQNYCFPSGTKGLIFCSSNKEARLLSQALNEHELYGRPLRTVALSGVNTIDEREQAVIDLQNEQIDFIITVDIFNEGIDIPDVNVVVLLRSTQSSIIFTQQLGRGLRKAENKETLRVIDVIGNYANNYLIPIALSGDRSSSKDPVREVIRRTRRHPISGSSTISFDEVSTQRVLESLQKVTLLDKRKCKEAIQNLKHRLGKVPRLVDFETHESIAPYVLASKYRNYWSLLHSLRFVDEGPSTTEDAFLTFLSNELLNGKRPQELLLLRALCREGSVDVAEFALQLRSRGLNHSDACLEAIEKILNLEWFADRQRATYGGLPVALRLGDQFVLGEDFSQLYSSYASTPEPSPISFRDHVDDVVETGLFLNRKHYRSGDDFIHAKRYSRKDACRLLNWSKNQESTVYGYKTDAETMTCPIFVTYHKDANISASVRYEDTLIDRSTLHWFTRHKRTLKSRELQPILNGDADLHLFAKREDADGTDFYYLGQVDAMNPAQTTMIGNDKQKLDVVTSDLKLRVPIPADVFDSLIARKTVAAPN